MKTRLSLEISILVAAAFAYGVMKFCEFSQIRPNLEGILANSNPKSAGIALSQADWKTFLLEGLPELVIFAMAFFATIGPIFKGVQLAQTALSSKPRNPFATLTALKNRRGQDAADLPFVARTEELAKLDAFAAHPDRFRWWVLSGEPGAGKTRLVWEWARTLKGWDVKVLNPKPDPEALKNWRPRRRCLIVVDEFAMRSDDLKCLAEALRDPALRKPLRLLLVDWATPDWLGGTDPVNLPLTQREGEPLVCADWDSKTFREALPQLWPKHLPPLDDARQQWLFELSMGNPLALSLWLARPDGPAQSKRQLFQRWAKDVRQGLLTKAVPENHLPLMALASWCAGYPWRTIDDCLPGYPKPAPDRIKRSALSAVPALAGRDGLLALAPETLAVEFALHELRDNPGMSYHRWLRRLAWEANPQGTARSLWRLRRLELQGGLDGEEREILGFLDASPVEAGCAEATLDGAVREWDVLRAGLVAEAEERKGRAWSLGDIIYDHGERGELAVMEAKFQELRGLMEAWPGDGKVRQAFAISLANLTAFYVEPNQLEAMASALDELRNLAHPGEAEIQLELATGLYNATTLYGKHGDWQATASALDELRSLAQAHPGEAAIQLQLAKGLYNAAKSYGNNGDWQAIASALDGLRSLAQASPGEAAIQLELAKGLVNAVAHYGRHGDGQAMASALDELCSLAQARPGEAEIQLLLAKGLYNAVTDYGKHGDWRAMDSALDGLRSLAQAYPGEAAIQLELAQELYNAATDYGKHGDWRAMDSALDGLRSLAQASPGEAAIQLLLTMGLHNQTILDPEHASAAIAELKTLAWRFPTHDGIQQRAHQHGVSYAQQQIAQREALERQARALLDARRR